MLKHGVMPITRSLSALVSRPSRCDAHASRKAVLMLLAMLMACPATVCTPSNLLSWTQPDGTAVIQGWMVRYSQLSYPCHRTDSSVRNYGFMVPPGTVGPMSVNVQLSLLTLTPGKWFVTVRGIRADGTMTACSPDISFTYSGPGGGAVPMDLHVR